MIDRQNKPETFKSTQELQNKSFDRAFEVLAVEQLGFNSGTNSLVRIAADANGNVLPGMVHTNIHTGAEELRVFSEGHVCVENSSSTPLGSNAVFTGDWQDTLNYTEVIVSVSADKNSATDGLVLNWSADGSTVNETDEFSILANSGKTFSFPCNRRYVKITYTNGAVAQTVFNIATYLKRFASKGSSHRISDSIVGDDDAALTKSVLTGVNPSGVFENVGVLYKRLQVQDKTAVTAFGDIRTAEITPVIQLSFDYTVGNTQMTTNTVTGSGAVTQGDAMARIRTGSTTGSIAELRSYHPCKYKAGLGGLVRMTARFTTPTADTSQWALIGDEAGSTADFKNGFAIGYNGLTFGVARFQNDTLFFTPLSSCDDPLDGTGASKMTLVPTNLNVYFIQFQYLGAGAVKFFVENDADTEEKGGGEMFVFNTIEYSNRNLVPSVYNSNFYVRFKANNKATTADLSIYTASCAYFTEGKTRLLELHQPQFSSGTIQKTGVTTEIALFSIRNKSLYASKTNLIPALLERVTVGTVAGAVALIGSWRLVKNATLGGSPSWANISTTDSIVELDTAGTTVTGGRELMSGSLFGDKDRATENAVEYDIILQPGEILTLSVQASLSATFQGSLLWKELF